MMLVLYILLLTCGVFQRTSATADCGKDEFPCNDGTCIEKWKWCDTTEDCPDDSDEHYCFKRSLLFPNPNRCNETFFLCLDGPCIPLSGRCDGYSSCGDHSDEKDCGTTIYPTNSTVTTDMAEEMRKTEVNIQSSTHTLSIEEVATGIYINTEAMRENLSSTGGATNMNWMSSTTDQPQLSTSSHHADLGEPSIVNEVLTDAHQADTAVKSREVRTKPTDVTRGFVKMNLQDFVRSKDLAQRWLLSVRDQDYGWGDETARALTALYMSDYISKKSEENLLMSKQLDLKIFAALMRNQSKAMDLSELSLYINALLASCRNPRNFYGYDFVDILRHRTNDAQEKSEFVSPLVYLTLCVSDATSFPDVKKIQEIFTSSRPEMSRTGLRALATLAAVCVSNRPKFQSYNLGIQLGHRLQDKETKQGLPENIYELALVVQALNEAKINQDLWNRSDALNRIKQWQDADGSWGDILSVYYVLPILSGKSLISLSSHCSSDTQTGMTPDDLIMDRRDGQLSIVYSLYFGDPVLIAQSLTLRVAKSTSILDLMRIAAKENQIYQFKLCMSNGKPSLYLIGGIANDAEKGLYWVLNISRRNTTVETNEERIVNFDGDIRTFILDDDDHVVFWLKKLR